MNRLFKSSKWMHKYFGLALALFFIWMSISGILLNHPDLISSLSLPPALTPPQYRFSNWNRGAATVHVSAQGDSSLSFIGGKTGVWVSTDNNRHFTRMTENFPISDFYGKTNSLLLIEDFGKNVLLAGMDGGLYALDLNNNDWKKIPLPSSRKKITKILRHQNKLYVFSESELFTSYISGEAFVFTLQPLPRQDDKLEISLVRYFFDIHGGEFLHLGGKLFYDLIGLIIIFLSASAVIIWFFPRFRTRLPFKSRNAIFRLSFKYHLKFGIFTAGMLLIIGGTAFFMRPPPLAILANKFVPVSYYPGFYPKNPWFRKIHNAAILPSPPKLIISAEDGIWSAPLDFSQNFQKEEINLPIFIMGATVFESTAPEKLIAGSFNGLYEYDFAAGRCVDYLSGEIVPEAKSNILPSDSMITGLFSLKDGEEYIFAHGRGLLNPDPDLFQADPKSIESIKMPLWNFMFELHNGRIFRDLIGGIYIILLPLGSLLFVLISLTGIYDWLFLKIFRKRRRVR